MRIGFGLGIGLGLGGGTESLLESELGLIL